MAQNTLEFVIKLNGNAYQGVALFNAQKQPKIRVIEQPLKYNSRRRAVSALLQLGRK